MASRPFRGRALGWIECGESCGSMWVSGCNWPLCLWRRRDVPHAGRCRRPAVAREGSRSGPRGLAGPRRRAHWPGPRLEGPIGRACSTWNDATLTVGAGGCPPRRFPLLDTLLAVGPCCCGSTESGARGRSWSGPPPQSNAVRSRELPRCSTWNAWRGRVRHRRRMGTPGRSDRALPVRMNELRPLPSPAGLDPRWSDQFVRWFGRGVRAPKGKARPRSRPPGGAVRVHGELECPGTWGTVVADGVRRTRFSGLEALAPDRPRERAHAGRASRPCCATTRPWPTFGATTASAAHLGTNSSSGTAGRAREAWATVRRRPRAVRPRPPGPFRLRPSAPAKRTRYGARGSCSRFSSPRASSRRERSAGALYHVEHGRLVSGSRRFVRVRAGVGRRNNAPASVPPPRPPLSCWRPGSFGADDRSSNPPRNATRDESGRGSRTERPLPGLRHPSSEAGGVVRQSVPRGTLNHGPASSAGLVRRRWRRDQGQTREAEGAHHPPAGPIRGARVRGGSDPHAN